RPRAARGRDCNGLLPGWTCPDARDLPGTSAARARDRAQDVQAPVRPPRRESPGGRTGDRRRARHLPEPRLRGCAERGARGDTRLALRRDGGRARLSGAARPLCPVPPGGGARAPRRVGVDRRLGRGAERWCWQETESSVGGGGGWRNSLSLPPIWTRSVPRRRDLESICLIGSGPIVIGQACEFDYAGCQALKGLREDGFRTIVVNSNPATIMTDPGFADRTYIEPLDLEGVAGVLDRERPDALLPTMGGQTA